MFGRAKHHGLRFTVRRERSAFPIPDPGDGANVFQGPVWYRTRETARWTMRPRPKAPANWSVAENTHGYNYDARGIGLLDLAQAVSERRGARASGDMAFHVYEAIEGMLASSGLGRFVVICPAAVSAPTLCRNNPTRVPTDAC